MSLILACEGWSIEAKHPTDDWDHNLLHKSEPVKTAFPLFFIGNTYDPVTPLRAGVKMAGKFKDAGLLEVETEGHCSLATVSICTIIAIRNYLDRGITPAPPSNGVWDKCPADERPWKPFTAYAEDAEDGGQISTWSAEELDVMRAWRALQQYSDEITRHITPPLKLNIQ
jgi:hypothetical protein